MKWFKSLFRVWRRETWLVFTDIGVMLFFFGLPLAYPIVYTLIYNPEVVTEIPTVIVDNSRTAESRDLARTLDATQAIDIKGYAANMAEARRAWAEKECYGIIEIPADYAKRLGQGGSATISFYNDMSLLIRYRQYLFALTGVQMHEVSEITAERVATRGGILATRVTGLPVDTASECLGDPTQGFASFVMPGIVVLILQQSMVLGICLIGGTAAERRRRNAPLAYSTDMASHGPMATILGKALCYVVFYIPVTIYILHYIPTWFDLPHIGNPADYLLLMLPFLLASAFFGIMLGNLMRQREDAFIYIVFTSVVFLFLSGLTWPRFAMPGLWHALAGVIPATWGVEGFIRINSNGATLAESSEPFLWLWGLAATYLAACYAIARITARGRRANRSH